MSTESPRRKAGRPARIDAAAVTEAAIGVIDAEGTEALTMRRLGTELGVAAMSLYRHLPNRDAVLASVVNRLAAEVRLDLPPDTDWPTALHAFATAYRRMLLAHPRAVPLLATHPVDETHGRRLIAPLLRAFTTAGVSDEEAVTAVQTVAVYVLGHALAQTGTPPGSPSDSDGDPTGAAPQHSYYDAWFTTGLDVFLLGLRHRLAAP
ncbi:TetR/AcrR family transcriptional regulator C-terminal domain-containing protein [Kitasatospora sp. NA04385]|uniref:TetR/AcrR family transcriptional regulator n=1 Tax=Kitasatospora sp. NA04385 TaxID=2742135 RepID=UPI001591C682|nr:TetR/AcrR family transcriptional regulator C-terminal domain-containing protein [Kitasatospora sp. NA04385]QKW21211.1 TetR/AcrR family transcriptional regulator C-terminal domain-containing protein [Kitasatospora sp. NA04385]